MIGDPLKPVFGSTGVMTTAVPGNVPPVPKVETVPQLTPQTIRPEIQALADEVDAEQQVLPQTQLQPQTIRPEIQSLADAVDAERGITPIVAPAPAPATAPPPVVEPPDSFFGDVKLAGRVIGTGLYSAIVDVLPKTLAETWIGGNLKVSDAASVVAQYRNQQIEELKRFDLTPAEEEQVLFGIIKAKNVLAGLQNLGYSAASAIGGMVAGAAMATAIPGVGEAGGLGQLVGGVLGAGLMTAPIAYRATKTQIVSDMRDKLLKANPKMTEDEWQVAKTLFDNEASKYAAWEAGPEIIGNMVTAGIIKTPAGTWIKQIPFIKNAIARTAASAGVKMGLDAPVEVGTEAITQMGQEAVQYRLGLQENPPTWLGAFKSVTPQTLVTTIATMGLGSVANQIQKPIAAKLKAPEKTSADIHADFVKLGIPEEIINQSGVVDKLVAAKTDAEYSKVLNDFAAENITEPVAPAPVAPAVAPAAPVVAPTAAQVDQVQPPAPVVLPAVTAEEVAAKPPDTGLPPLKEIPAPQAVEQVPLTQFQRGQFQQEIGKRNTIAELRELEKTWDESPDDQRQQEVLELIQQRKNEISAERGKVKAKPTETPAVVPVVPLKAVSPTGITPLVPPLPPTPVKATDIVAGPRTTAQPEGELGALPSKTTGAPRKQPSEMTKSEREAEVNRILDKPGNKNFIQDPEDQAWLDAEQWGGTTKEAKEYTRKTKERWAQEADDAQRKWDEFKKRGGVSKQSDDLAKEAIKDAHENGASPEFRAFFGGIDPEIAGTTPEKVRAFAKKLGMEWHPVAKPDISKPPIAEPAPAEAKGMEGMTVAPHERSLEIQKEYGLDPSEAAAVNNAIERLTTTKVEYTTAAEALSKESMRMGARSGVSFAKIADLKLMGKIVSKYAPDFRPLGSKPSKPVSPEAKGTQVELAPHPTPDIQQTGRDTTVYGTRKESFPAKYVVVPRKSLIASHDAGTFSRNPEYPLENPRDYSTEGERTKVLEIKRDFTPDQHITDSTSSAVGPVMAAHIIDEKGNRRLVVLGGNTREMVTQSISKEKQKALADYTNEHSEQYGIKKLPDADHELIRYMGEFDISKPGVRKKVQGILDSLNPSPGKAQTVAQMAIQDADRISPELLSDVDADITAENAQKKMRELLVANEIDSNTRKAASEDGAQAQDYVRRLLINAAFRKPNLADFASTSDRDQLVGRGLLETASPTAVELRRRGEGKMADIIGDTMAEIVGYMKGGDNLQVAVQRVSQQPSLKSEENIRMEIAATLLQRIALKTRVVASRKTESGKRNIDVINTDETIDNFISLWDRVLLAVKEWQNAPDLASPSVRDIKEVITFIMRNIRNEQEKRYSYRDGGVSMSRKALTVTERKVAELDRRAQELKGVAVPFSLISDPVMSPAALAAEEARKLRQAEAERKAKLEEQVQELSFMPQVKVERAQSKIDQYTVGWKNKPKGGIKVVQSEEDATDNFSLSDDSRQAIRERKAEGFYHIPTDTVVIIADNLERPIDAVRVAIHEATVHSGLRNLLGAEFNAELERIGKDIPEADLTDIALIYNLDMSKPADRLEAYEEYLGKYAETRNPKLWDRFIMAVKRALRNMGINEHVIDYFEKRGAIDQIVDAGREYVERGRRPVTTVAGKGVRMSLASRVPEGTARKDVDERRFLKKAIPLLSEKLTPEDLQQLKANLKYAVAHNEESDQQADAKLAELGPVQAEELMWRDDKSIPPAVRIPLWAKLQWLHIAAAEKATDPQTHHDHMQASIDIANKIAVMLTESGQISQSAAMYHSGAILASPGGAELYLKRRVDAIARAEIDKLPVTTAEIIQEAQKADNEAAIETLASERAQKEVDKILERLGATAWQHVEKTWKSKAEAIVASAEHVKYMKMNVRFSVAATMSLEEKMMVAVHAGIDYISSSKTLNYGDWSAKMKARFGEGITPHLRRVWNEVGVMLDAEGKARTPRVSKDAKAATKKQPVSVTGEMGQMVRDWLTQPPALPTIGEAAQLELDRTGQLTLPTQKNIIDRLITFGMSRSDAQVEMERQSKEWLAKPMEKFTIGEAAEQDLGGVSQPTLPTQKTIIDNLTDLGLTKKEAFLFVTEIQRDNFKRAQAAKERRLQQLLKGKPLSKIDKAAVQRMMEISAIRRLDDAAIIDIFAEKMGLPKLTPEIAGKMQDLAEKIRKAPEGSQNVEATRKIMEFMEKLMPLVKGDVGWAMWYANMLSGYQTQERNILSTFANVTANLVTSMMVDPKNAPFALVGFVTGIKKGWREAKNVAKTGEIPLHIIAQGKIEAPTVLERSPFKGFAKVLNNWKYVLRLMVAEDAMMFKLAQEQRAMMISADIARAEGKVGRQLWERVAEIMGTTGKQIGEFETLARAEGHTGARLQRRMDEMAEQQRSPAVMKPSVEYAKYGTFNHQPEGWLGIIAQWVRQLSRRLPAVRFVVPFTQIVANVTNTSIDYTPWGFVRSIVGISQISGGRRAIVGHERAQLLAKATIGTIAMASTYLLDKLNSGDDDDDKGWFAIYGKGTGDYNKDNQMRERGWAPWTARFGKRYIDYRLTPFAIPFGLIGSVRDAERWRKLDEKSLVLRFSFAAFRSLSVMTDMSFMSGLTAFAQGMDVQSPERAAKVFQSIISRHIVGAAMPNFFKQLDRTFDPNLRDNATIQEALLREIPIASRWGSPKLNVLGEQIPQRIGPVSLVISHAKEDPVWNLIVNNEAWISDPKGKQSIGEGRNKRQMTESEYYKFIQYRGEKLRARIEKNMFRFEGKSKEWVNKRIDDYTQDAAESAKVRIGREYKERQLTQTEGTP